MASTLAIEAATVTSVAAIVISALSLTLSGVLFWATWARPGRLRCNIPTRVAWVRLVDPTTGTQGGVQLAIPLVFYNTGARALVVEDLGLHVQTDQTTMLWSLTRDSTFFRADEPSDSGRAFHVGGRESVERVAQFTTRDGSDPNVDEGVPTLAIVLAQLANRPHLEPVTMVLLLKPERPIGVESEVSWANELHMARLRTRWRKESRGIRKQYRESQKRQFATLLGRPSGAPEAPGDLGRPGR